MKKHKEKVEIQEQPQTETEYNDIQELSPEIIASLEFTKEQTEAKLEEVQTDDQSAVETYLEDPKVKEEATQSAQYLLDHFKNWFTIEQVNKKTVWKDPKQAYQVLQMLCLSGVVSVTENEQKLGTLKYKVTMNPEDKATVVELEIERLGNELADITVQYGNRIAGLQKSLENLKQKVA